MRSTPCTALRPASHSLPCDWGLGSILFFFFCWVSSSFKHEPSSASYCSVAQGKKLPSWALGFLGIVGRSLPSHFLGSSWVGGRQSGVGGALGGGASCAVPFRLPHSLPPPLGRKVVVVRCEGINISGNFYRNKRKLGHRRWARGLSCEGLRQPCRGASLRLGAGPGSVPCGGTG